MPVRCDGGHGPNVPGSPALPRARPGRPDSADRIRFPAYVLSKAGAVTRPAVVQLGHQDLPAGEVLVRVEWSAVNYKDALVTRPGNRLAAGYPLVPGVELTGIVEQSSDEIVGARSSGARAGVRPRGDPARRVRRVRAGTRRLGGRPPDALSCRDAAMIGVAGFAALLSKRRLLQYGISPGDGPVLVTGASGGVGSAAVAAPGACRVRGGGFHRQDDRARLPRGPRRGAGGRALTTPTTTAAPSAPSSGLAPSTAWAASPSPRRCAPSATGERWLPRGLAGGNVLTTTVYPFIVRGVALLGIDTESTPIEERRPAWAEMPDSFPLERCEEMVDEEIGLERADRRARPGARRRRARPHPRSARPLSAPGGNGIQPA